LTPAISYQLSALSLQRTDERSAPVQDFRNLTVWQAARRRTKAIYERRR